MPDSIPLVLVPALSCTADLYSAQLSALGKFGQVTIADHQRHESMEAIARSVLEQAPPRFALAGLSMGGYVALEIMRLAPERVLRLALMSTSARPDTPEQTTARRQQIAAVQAGKYAQLVQASLPGLLHRVDDEGLRRQLVKMAADIGPDAFIRQLKAIMSRTDSRPLLASIQCPTLVLVGINDKLTPPERLKEIADGIEGSRYVEIPDCGHASTLEQPELTKRALVEWLS